MNIVLKATQNPNGTIEIETVDGKKFVCIAIRGGISWSLLSENMPPYYCILGEEWLNITRFQGNEKVRGRIKLLGEYENDINRPMSSLYERLTDDTTLCHCPTVYGITEGDQSYDYKGFPDELKDFIREKGVDLSVQQAPFAENPRIGIDQVMDWNTKGLLDFPEESLLRQQLRSLNPEDTKDFQKRLNAVNALRFVLCSFWKYRPTLTSNDWRKKVRKGSWRA